MSAGKKDIGVRLETAIAKAGITQKELARRTGIAETNISAYKTGDRYPKTETLVTLCSALGVSIDWLITGKSAETLLQVSKEDAIKEALKACLSDDQKLISEIREAVGIYKPPSNPKEETLMRIFRRLHPAEQDKVLEIAQLYDGAKERCKNDGEVNSLKELKSGSK